MVQHIEKNYENVVQRLDFTQNLFGKNGVSRRIIRIIEKTMIMTKN
jgi:UDP-N-acetylglucosamine 2-epimerase